MKRMKCALLVEGRVFEVQPSGKCRNYCPLEG
jgi:hypothetical protein